jgi:hypothetical protein
LLHVRHLSSAFHDAHRPRAFVENGPILTGLSANSNHRADDAPGEPRRTKPNPFDGLFVQSLSNRKM